MIEKDLNFQEFIDILGWKKSKFFENIGPICSKDVYDIDVGNFRIAGKTKVEYTKNEINFCFKKEWADLALVLFKMFEKNPYYRVNSKASNRSLEEVVKYNEYCLNLIDKELPIYQRQQIQMHPVYEATFIEKKIMEELSNRINTLLLVTSNMPIETRTEFWLSFNELINYNLINSYLVGMQTKEKMDAEKGDRFKKLMHGEYTYKCLDFYVADVLKREMNQSAETERKKLFDVLNEERKALDEIEIKESGDSPEFIRAVDDHWAKIDGERLVQLKNTAVLEAIRRKRRKEALGLLGSRLNLASTVNKLIEELSSPETDSDQQIVKHLNEIKKIINQKNVSDDGFKTATTQMLKELNYGILNRR